MILLEIPVSNFSDDNWNVVVTKKQLPSETVTSVPNCGYGGFGWLISINSRFYDCNDFVVILKKYDSSYEFTGVRTVSDFLLIPDGGSVNEYYIVVVGQDSSK